MLTKWINSIARHECAPNECREQDYQNKKPVIHFEFSGDGSAEYEERATESDLEIVASYIQKCKQQIAWANEYILSKKSEFDTKHESAAQWLQSMAGIFDSSGASQGVILGVHLWMRRRVDEAIEDKYDDLIKYGEINITMLAEDALYDSGYFTHEEAEAEDETHWVWDLAVEVEAWYNETKDS